MSNASSASLAFTQSLKSSGLGARAVAVLLGSLFIAAAAQVQVPMLPVPMTMQTFAVLAVGVLYGSRLGALTVLAYLAEGALGLPVFTGFGNLMTVIAAPFTAGYLVGFVAAAAVAGAITERGAGPLRSLAAVIAGSAMIYGFGLTWLAYWMWVAVPTIGGDVSAAITAAITGGLLPFLVGDAVKAAMVVALRETAGRVSIRR